MSPKLPGGTALLAALLLAAPSASAATCPTAPDPAALPGAASLKQMNTFVAKLGARPTGSPEQARYIDWIRKRLKKIPGLQLSELRYPIDRWSSSSATLRFRADGRTVTLPVASAIPYSKGTGRGGVAAPLAVVPSGEAISAANAKGKIVVRDAKPGSVPQAAFLLPVISWGSYDPKNTIDPSQSFYGDFIAYNDRMADLRNAAAAGARGILFVKDLPQRQIKGHYEPYDGIGWDVSGLFLGADEGKRITDAIAAGKTPSARITVRSRYDKIVTPTLIATIPGQSAQRVVIDSHTDGTNAAEDNGPVAMVAMARYYAALPRECRPRTIQFAFSTAHFYQRLVDKNVRHGGAGQLAAQLDADFDKGTVSSVVVLEHLGAIEYAAVPRADGGPGNELKPTGQRAIQFVAVTPSRPLVAAVDGVVRKYDMQRTLELQGSDLPGSTTPAHCSFGGEGTPYNQHLLPTVGVIAAPQSLYDPAFGLEGIDFEVMRSELLGYTELVTRLGTMAQADVEGTVPAERAQRKLGAPPCNG